MDNEEYIKNGIHTYTVLSESYAFKMNKNLVKIFSGKSESYKSRGIRVINNFFEFCFENELAIKGGADVAVCFSAWNEQFIENELKDKSPNTVISEVRALWLALRKLSSNSVKGLPSGSPIPKPRRISRDVFTNIENEKSKLLGDLNLSKEVRNESVTLTLETDPDTFIKHLVDTMIDNRDVIYNISKQYLEDAIQRLNFGNEAKKKVGAEKFWENDDLLHPTQTAYKSGQKLSLFSDYLSDGECGYTNLIAYIAHCQNGLINRNFVGGNNSLYRFTRNQHELREHFGISSISAVAACNIIIIESGINVDSLRNLKLTSFASMSDFFEVVGDGGFRIKYHKARAKANISRKLDHAVATPYIQKAFNYLVDATAHHRSLVDGSDTKSLFLYHSPTQTGLVAPMSSLPFKWGFKNLLRNANDYLEKNPDWCEGVSQADIDEVLKYEPNAKKLRATEGVIRWFNSGGDPRVAAKYLGNSEVVALNNYIPEPIRIAVYNQKVRRFQNVLIAAATDTEPFQIAALNLKDEGELNKYLGLLDKRVPHWRTVVSQIASMESRPSSSDTTQKITLSICPENIAVIKACYELSLNGDVSDNIKELSVLYLPLKAWINENASRGLKRIAQKGERLYERTDFKSMKITKARA
ncbi:hypothetical protein [Vibrio sp. TBV020]|uniref:hypothetical protein n=1 Tax=Vibrio sp. TBV020 TaxID=3137398 RepID=UPI0038CD9699